VTTPPFPNAFASKGSGLGAPKRYFPVKKIHRVGSLLAFFFLLGAAVMVFLDGLLVAYQSYQKHGPAVIGDSLALPGLLALALFLAGLAAGWWAFTNRGRGVVVYERGFAIHDRKGIQLWRWEEIVSLTEAVKRSYAGENSTGMRHVYRLVNRRNQQLVLTDVYSKVEELAMIIRDTILPGQYEQAAQRYNAGQRLVFGPVIIDQAGIQMGKKTYAWAEVRQVSIRRGILKISKTEAGWFNGASTPISAIPNLHVLLNIIHQVVGLKTG
jgi:hypothetical protein